VYCYIAQHLTGKDLLAMSEVSTAWNQFAESNKIGEKVRLKFNADALSVEDFKIIAYSSRNYKDVSMKAESEASSSALWIFADTAEKLSVNITDKRSSEFSKDFPMLKSLEVTSNPYQQNAWIFDLTMDRLEDLKYTVDEESRCHENFHIFLGKQKNLKRLDLSDSDYEFGYCDYKFIHQDCRPTFQLEYLKAHVDSLSKEFLDSQRESLRTLSDCSTGGDVRSFLSEYPNLSTLELPTLESSAWLNDVNENKTSLPINTTIQNLVLHSVNYWKYYREEFFLPFKRFQEIILSLPELVSLKIEKVTIEMMEFIALNLQKLKELKFSIDEDGAWDRYEKMKRGVKGINSEIQLVVESHPPIEQVRISKVERSESIGEDGEIPLKRPKEASLDPLDSEILPKRVHGYITQHLTGKDLLAMSEVSTTWNEVAESNKIGDKVRLKFNADALSVEDFKIMTSSARKYKEVSMKAENEASAGAVWIFSDTVEKLTVDIRENKESKRSIDFPKLKSIDITATDIDMDEDDPYFCEGGNVDSWFLRSNMAQLEDIKLKVCYESHRCFYKFLANKKNLKSLDLSDCSEFVEGFNEMPLFQLDSLKLNSEDASTLLQTQRESLQNLADGECYKNDVAFYLSEFTKLTKLELSRCNNADWQEDEQQQDLPVNKNIKSLNLLTGQENRYEPFDLVSQDILVALPELESLYVENLTVDLMEFIALNLHKLKQLSCRSAEDGAWERYEEMKQTEVVGINSKIQFFIQNVQD
jgi:hypothetical protein